MFRLFYRLSKQKVWSFPYCYVVFAALSGWHVMAYSAAPTTYGAWENIDGVIKSNCPMGFECETDINDDGLLQRRITDPVGDRFVQQVLNKKDADRGDISVESFVKMQDEDAETSTEKGISAQQVIEVDLSSDGEQFNDMKTYLNLGWANEPGKDAVLLLNESYQEPAHLRYTKGSQTFQLSLTEKFRFSARRDANDKTTGTSIDISQTVENHTAAEMSFHYPLNDVPGPGPIYIRQPGERGRGSPEPYRTVNENGVDRSKFVLRQRSGDYVTSSSRAVLSNSGSDLFTRPYRGPAFNRPPERFVDWDSGDTIRVVWAGQICNGCDWAGWAQPFNDYFGYVQYDNLSDNYESVSDFTISSSQINVGVEAWDEGTFGPMPLVYPERGQLGSSPDPYVHVARPGPPGCCEVPVPLRSDSF